MADNTQPQPVEASSGDLLVPRTARTRTRTAGSLPPDAFNEIGTSGLRQYGGFVLEEWLQQLTGRRAAWVYREMLDNDPTVGAIMFAIRWLARGVEWRVEEGNQPEAAELVESCMDDMSHTWGDFISEALSMLPYGWAFHEIVYKRRQGAQPQLPQPTGGEMGEDGTSEDDGSAAGSKYNDGRIGWRKLPIRAQETLLNWEFDGYSGLKALRQVDYHGGNHIIPIEKAVLFRTQTTRQNPEGRSILRNSFTSYFSIRELKRIEAIGAERDLAGIPVAKAPEGVDIFSPQYSALYAKVKQMVTGLRNDEYSGIVLPDGWELELLASGGSKQMDTDAIIRRYRQDIATSMLADFVLIGQDSVGSFAMVDVKSDLFGIAIDGVLDLICEVMNRYAIPRLLELNGMDITEPPRIEHGTAGRLDLEKVGSFLYQLAGAGAPIPWSTQLLGSLFEGAALPANFEEDAQEPVPVVPGVTVDAAGASLEHAAGPADLPDGTAGFAREPHMEPGPAPTPPTSTPTAAAAAQVAKAELAPNGNGTTIHLTPTLRDRHTILAAQLEQEIITALGQLGTQAASAYETIVHKASRSMLHRIVARVMQQIGLAQWIDRILKPILQNHASRVIADTQRTIQAELHAAAPRLSPFGDQLAAAERGIRAQINLEVRVADDAAERIIAATGTGLGMRDIEPQVRQSILQAIQAGLERGEHPNKTAQRIRADVPAGRFVNAGARYRARLIARNETAVLQRAAAVAAYQSNPSITGVQARDGIFGPPRSDEECIARNGLTVPVGDAASLQALHPLCSLSLDPVVSGTVNVPVLQPAAA